MNMWYAIIEKATGRLHSTGTVLADPMPKEYEVKELGESFSQEGLEWDASTKAFMISQFMQRVQTYALNRYPWIATLTASQKQDLKSLITELLTKVVGMI